MKELDLLKQFLIEAKKRGIIDQFNAAQSDAHITEADIAGELHFLESIGSLPESEQKTMYDQVHLSIEQNMEVAAERALRESNERQSQGKERPHWFKRMLTYIKNLFRLAPRRSASDVGDDLADDAHRSERQPMSSAVAGEHDLILNKIDSSQDNEYLERAAQEWILQGENILAVKAFERALENCREGGNKSEVFGCYINIGCAYQLDENCSRAIQCFSTALEYALQYCDKRCQALAYANVGSALSRSGHHIEKGIGKLRAAERLSIEIGDSHRHFVVCKELGYAYGCLNKTDLAISYYRQALRISDGIGVDCKLYCLLDFGRFFQVLEDGRNAMQCYEDALRLATATKDTKVIASCYMYIGDVLVVKGDLDDAIANYKRSKELAEDTHNGDVLGQCMSRLMALGAMHK